MAKPIGYIYGTAIAPGVSVNRRIYTREHIRGAVEEAQARIAAGQMAARDLDATKTDPHPLSTKTHHDAEDDSEKLAGRVDELTYEESTGRAKYKLAVPNTPAGRTMLELADTEDGAPFIRGMSIRGRWVGETKRVIADDGQPAETADGLQLVGLDFTSNPGVRAALIDRVERVGATSSRESSRDPSLIYESAPEAPVTITEVAADVAETAPPTLWADPGYQADKAKRLPLDTPAQAVTAWLSLRESGSAYTDTQRKRIRERVQKALVRHGATLTPEKWVVTSGEVTEAGMWPPSEPGSYSVCLSNGMVTINVSSWRVDPADLDMAARAAMEGACAALAQLDPDMDGDIDRPDSPDETALTLESVRETEGFPPDAAADVVMFNQTSPTAATPAADHLTEQETGMAESTTPAAGVPAESAPADNAPQAVAEPMLSLGQVKDLFASFAAAMTPQPVAVESAPAAPVVETAVEETADEKLARLVAEGIKAALPSAVQAHVQENGVTRKGLVVETAPQVSESSSEYPEGWPTKDGNPLAPHELSAEQYRAHALGHLAGALKLNGG